MTSVTHSTSAAAERLRQRGYDPDQLVSDYQTRGYVILDGVLDPTPSSPYSLESLRKCAEQATQLTRQGHWKARRVVGNAFPPFDRDNSDSWGVQHIMNPQLDLVAAQPQADAASSQDTPSSSSPLLSRTFQEFYSSSPLLDVASLLIGSPEERLQMELFNLLINPESHRFALGWHRDDIRPETDELEEQKRLETPTYGVQFNTALYDDGCLFIVSGSHKRLRSEEEKRANLEKAPPPVAMASEQGCEDHSDGRWDIDPPETLRVQLKAGQTAFYSQRILHRASYLPSQRRATLHGCYGDIGDDLEGEAGGAERARNVLQHGVEWMRDEQFGARLPPRLRPMWSNLIRMEGKWAAEKLGYSLDN